MLVFWSKGRGPCFIESQFNAHNEKCFLWKKACLFSFGYVSKWNNVSQSWVLNPLLDPVRLLQTAVEMTTMLLGQIKISELPTVKVLQVVLDPVMFSLTEVLFNFLDNPSLNTLNSFDWLVVISIKCLTCIITEEMSFLLPFLNEHVLYFSRTCIRIVCHVYNIIYGISKRFVTFYSDLCQLIPNCQMVSKSICYPKLQARWFDYYRYIY